MINVAVSKNTLYNQPALKNHIESLMQVGGRKIFNVSHTNDLNDNNVDIFIVNTENYDTTIIDNTKAYFVFVGNDLSKVIINNNACNNYFIKSPLDFEKVDEILLHIRKKIQNNFIVVQTGEGDMKLQINELNYIDIFGRTLCYHLCNKEERYSSTLTTSFKKAIAPLDKHDLLLFIKPSLLINISKIRIIDTNKITFENGDSIPVASTQRKIIQKEWEQFYDFDNRYKY